MTTTSIATNISYRTYHHHYRYHQHQYSSSNGNGSNAEEKLSEVATITITSIDPILPTSSLVFKPSSRHNSLLLLPVRPHPPPIHVFFRSVPPLLTLPLLSYLLFYLFYSVTYHHRRQSFHDITNIDDIDDIDGDLHGLDVEPMAEGEDSSNRLLYDRSLSANGLACRCPSLFVL
jgi:hypothetical protein